ncbi:MAG TPA: hypothetical protein DCR97_13195 [Deltaproteobacteria bacterium]|nr:hypothetical protein [Deltaproteobacteria bacterium]
MIKFIKHLLMATAVPDGEEKIRSAIAFFALEHERLTQKPLAASSLNKYVTLLDHVSLEKVGSIVFGRHFRKIVRTLTNPRSTEEMRKDDCFTILLQDGEYVVKATKEPDLSHFSSLELEEMKRLVKLNSLRKVLHTRFSSLETKGARRLGEVDADLPDNTWEEAWFEIKKAVTDASEGGVVTKPKEVDEMTGLDLLVEKYEARLKDLEAQMTELKGKLETVMEALHLLKEEGLLEDEPKPGWP